MIVAVAPSKISASSVPNWTRCSPAKFFPVIVMVSPGEPKLGVSVVMDGQSGQLASGDGESFLHEATNKMIKTESKKKILIVECLICLFDGDFTNGTVLAISDQ